MGIKTIKVGYKSGAGTLKNPKKFPSSGFFSLTCNDLANALPIGASLIVSIRENAFSVPWSVKHQNLEFLQMFKESERLWRILNCVIKLHPVIVFKFKSAITVFDKVIPSIFIETVQSGVLKSMLIQPYTGWLINA